ncbi:MAG: hypothetical protein WCJ46_05875 [bacterium]
MRVSKAIILIMITTVFIFLVICGMAPKVKNEPVVDAKGLTENSLLEKDIRSESEIEVQEAETRRLNKSRVEEVIAKAKKGIDVVFEETLGNKMTSAVSNTAEDMQTADAEDMVPKPTVTPAYKLTKAEIKVWDNVDSSKNLIAKCERDVAAHEKFLREHSDKDLLSLQNLISTFHVSPVIHDRDKIEYMWQDLTRTAEKTFSITEKNIIEMKENQKTIKRLQKENSVIIDKQTKEIQKIDQVKNWYKTIQTEVKALDKEIIHLDEAFDRYKINYKKIIEEKAKTIKALLDTHNELHKY